MKKLWLLFPLCTTLQTRTEGQLVTARPPLHQKTIFEQARREERQDLQKMAAVTCASGCVTASCGCGQATPFLWHLAASMCLQSRIPGKKGSKYD